MSQRIGGAYVDVGANTRPLAAGLAGAERMTASSLGRMQAMSGQRMAAVGQNMSRLGQRMSSTVTLPMVAAGAAAFKFASDFESALTQVRTQAGASAKEIDGMRAAIIKLAPQVGQTPVALANALYRVESAGIRGRNALDIMTQGARLAKIGHSDLEQTMSGLVAVMKTAPDDVKSASDAIGLMNAIVGTGNMRMQDLVGALSTGIIPAAKSAGLGLRDIGSAIDVLTTRGMPAQAAATRLGMTIALMSSPTEKAAAALAKVGIRQHDLANDLRKPDGMYVALTDLKKHMQDAGLSAVEQNALITRAFGGGRSSRAILTLIQNTGDLKKSFDQIGRSSAPETTRKAWDATTKDMGFQWDRFKAQAQATAIRVGTAIGPTLLRIGESIASSVERVAKAFTSLPKGAQDMLIRGGIVLAAMGPALRLAGIFTTLGGRLWDAAKLVERLAGGGGLATLTRGGGAAAAGAGAQLPLFGAGAEATAKRQAGRVATGLRSGLGVAFRGAGIAAGGMLVTEIGSYIAGPGSAGKWVKAIGTGASIGAGIGSVFGPAGAAGGAVIGGLAAAVFKWSRDQAAEEGRNWADRFVRGTNLGPRVNQQLQDAYNRRPRTRDPNQQPGDPGSNVTRRSPPALTPGDLARPDQARARNEKAWYNYYWALGRAGGQGAVAAMQSIKVPTAPALLRDIIYWLKTLPGQARPWGARTMLAYVQGLERNHKLPAGTVADMIEVLKHEFPGLQAWLRRQGILSGRSYVNNLNFKRAGDNLSNTFKDMRATYGWFDLQTKVNARNVWRTWGTYLGRLQSDANDHTSKTWRQSAENLKRLREDGARYMRAMQKDVSARIGDMRHDIINGSGQAAQKAGANFRGFASQVQQAMAAGVLSANQGAKLLGEALNSVLKAFGAPTIPQVALKAMSPKSIIQYGNWATNPQGNAPTQGIGRKARGGITQFGAPGARGHDDILANFGGQQVMVAPGEVGMVLTGDQQAVANMLLSPIGGLGGLFSHVTRPHYAARGWIQKAAQGMRNVVASAESLGGTGYKGNPIQPYGWSELSIPPNPANAGTALGSLPYLTRMRIRAGTREVVAAKQDIGAGSSFNPVMGLYPGTVGQLGLSGGEFHVAIQRADGQPLTVGSGSSVGAAIADAVLKVPEVKGKGTMATLVRSALGKETKAANAYIRAHAPTTVSGGAGGVGTGFGARGGGGVGTFDGKQVANWIIPILNWARGHGWHGAITSGYRPGDGNSWHASLAFPKGAVDVGGPAALAEGRALWSVLSRYPGGSPLRWSGNQANFYPAGGQPGGYDWGHFSTGHARGGFIRRLARGGLVSGALRRFAGGGVPFGRLARTSGTGGSGLPGTKGAGSFPRKAEKAPRLRSIHKQKPSSSPDVPSSAGGYHDAGTPVINKLWREISTDLSSIGAIQERYQVTSQMDDLTDYVFVVGEGDAASVDWGAVQTRASQIMQYIEWQNQILWILTVAKRKFGELILRLETAVRVRQKEITRRQTQIRVNLRRIAALERDIKRDSKSKAKGHETRNAGRNRTIHGIKNENEKLGGDRDKVGTDGQIGQIQATIDKLTEMYNPADKTGSVIDARKDIQGESGIGGQLGDTRYTLAELGKQLATVDRGQRTAGGGPIEGGALAKALAEAGGAGTGGAGGAGGTGSGTSEAQIDALKTINAQQAQQLEVMKAQYNVLSRLPPFGGTFHLGGIVPGPVGAERLALVKAGERISPDGGSIHEHNIIFGPKTEWLRDYVDVRIEQRTREMARSARPTPGARAGQLGRR